MWLTLFVNWELDSPPWQLELRCCIYREDDALSSADLTYTYGNDHSYNMTVDVGTVRACCLTAFG